MHGYALTLHRNINEVEPIVEVELDGLVILLELSGRERNRNLNLFLARHQHLSRHNWEVQVNFLLEVRFHRNCLVVNICDRKHLLDGYRLGHHEALTKVKDILVESHARFASRACELEFILGSGQYSQCRSVRLELILS